MPEFDILKNAGWNASDTPNGFINRPETIANNDHPDGLSTTTSEIEIETTPEHLNLVSRLRNLRSVFPAQVRNTSWRSDHGNHHRAIIVPRNPDFAPLSERETYPFRQPTIWLHQGGLSMSDLLIEQQSLVLATE